MRFNDIDDRKFAVKRLIGWNSTYDLLNDTGKTIGFDYVIPLKANGCTNYLTCVDNGYDKDAIFTCGAARVYDYSFEINKYLNSTDTEITQLQDAVRIVAEHRSYKFLKFMDENTFEKIVKRNNALISQLNERLENNKLIKQINEV